MKLTCNTATGRAANQFIHSTVLTLYRTTNGLRPVVPRHRNMSVKVSTICCYQHYYRYTLAYMIFYIYNAIAPTFVNVFCIRNTSWMEARLGTMVYKFGRDPAICLVEEAICVAQNVYGQTDGQQCYFHSERKFYFILMPFFDCNSYFNY